MASATEDTKMLANAVASDAAEQKNRESPTSITQRSGYVAPGRLGTPNMELRDDPRLDTKLKPTLAAFGLDGHMRPPFLDTLKADSSLDEIAETIGISEEMTATGLYGNAPLNLPEDEHEIPVTMTEEVIKGGDGQDMKLYLYRPTNPPSGEKLRCVMHSHGGGMTLIPTMNRVHDRWCRSLAVHGVLVVMVDFRNAWTKEGYNHFPAGLNDCAAACNWIHSHRDQLGVDKIILEGESGGGNLSLAVALKAKKEGWIDEISGVFALIPYISNAYGWTDEEKLRALPSLIECNGYFLNMQQCAFNAHFYTPKAADQRNPLAWPYYASIEDMKGLPPHRLVMDELDPLRDEGISYARRLIAAGVSSNAKVNLGTVHGALIFGAAVPEYWNDAARDVAAFAKEV